MNKEYHGTYFIAGINNYYRCLVNGKSINIKYKKELEKERNNICPECKRKIFGKNIGRLSIIRKFIYTESIKLPTFGEEIIYTIIVKQ